MLPAAGRFFKVVGRRKQLCKGNRAEEQNVRHIKFTARGGRIF
jgi:hypothetical protein